MSNNKYIMCHLCDTGGHTSFSEETWALEPSFSKSMTFQFLSATDTEIQTLYGFLLVGLFSVSLLQSIIFKLGYVLLLFFFNACWERNLIDTMCQALFLWRKDKILGWKIGPYTRELSAMPSAGWLQSIYYGHATEQILDYIMPIILRHCALF